MKKSCFCLAILLLAFDTIAQQSMQQQHQELNKQNAISLLLKIRNGIFFRNTTEVKNWFIQNQHANIHFDIRAIDSNIDLVGNTHIRYQQFYQNIPVEGAMINLHCKGITPHSFNGTFFPNLNIDISVFLKEKEALILAQKTFPSNALFAWDEYDNELIKKQGISETESIVAYPKAEMVIISKDATLLQKDFRIAYQFNILSSSPFLFKKVFVDAQDGTILYTKELIYHIDKKGTAHTKYSGIQNIICDSIAPNKYTLIERGRGLDSIIVRNSKAVVSSFLFYDDDNYWNNFNAQKDEVATDIFWGIEQTYDYYKSRYSRNSYDNKGHAVQGNAHAGSKSESAYWVSAGIAVFGDGDDTMYNAWTSIDIVGHEFTHGVTESTANLYYEKESGALNESYSDIFGKCIEHFALIDSFTWDFGKPNMLNGYPSMRSFSDPNSRKHPKYYRGKYYNDTTNNDNYGVHTNSSVQNYWFYLLSEGGIGLREADSKPYNVHRIGIDTAAIIAYYTLTNYLTPTSKFIDAAMYSIAATKILFGDSSHLVQEVINAWYAVGVLNTTSIFRN